MNSKKPLRLWLLRLAIWDVFMPIIVWTSPLLVKLLLPNNHRILEATVLIFPIVAFVARYRIGRYDIESNRSQIIRQGFQLLAFFFGIAVLFVIDILIILGYVMPSPAHKNGCTGFLIIYSVYLFFMAIAMYPGLNEPQEQ